MSIAIVVSDYNDFPTLVHDLPVKFTVFFVPISANSGTFQCWAVSLDMNSLVSLVPMTTTPTAFATDFPHAIALESAPVFSTEFERGPV